MSLKTDLPFEVTRFCEEPINLGKAAGTNWSLLARWLNQELESLVIEREDSCGALNIHLAIRSNQHQFIEKDIHVTKCIEDGQTTAELEMPSSYYKPSFPLPIPFQYRVLPFLEVKGIITVSKFEEKANIMPKLSLDFLRLLNNPDFFPDAILKCGDTEISVHKSILSVRSPVFAAMFKNEMQEGISGIARIENLEPNALLAMLKYIYSDRADNLTDVLAGDLLFAADEYQLHELKSICIDKLKSSLTVNNVFRALRLGDLHDSGLKDHATDFVCTFGPFSELEMTEDWNSLKRNHTDLAFEVLTSIVKYKENRY